MARLGARARDVGVAIVLLAWLLSIASRYFTADRGGFTEEAIPFRQALTLWGWGDAPATANPHFFSYPSLSIYAHAGVQWLVILFGRWSGRYANPADAGVEFVLDPTHLVLAGRWLLGWVTLAGAWAMHAWWRSRSRQLGALAALGFFLCPLVVRSVLRMPPEVFMAPLAVLLVMAASAGQGHRPWRAVWTGVLAGLLLGTKLSAIPAALLCLGVASVASRSAARTSRSLALGAAVALLTFVATTPFAVLDLGSFWAGTRFEWEHLTTGHLLGSAASSAAAHGKQLFAAVGYPLLAALFALCFVGRELPVRAWLALAVAASFVIPALFSASGGPERYMLPAIPLLWLFVTEVMHACANRSGARWRIATVLLGLIALGQLGMMASDVWVGRLEVPTAAAGDWLRQHAKPDDIIVAERGALALPSLANARELQSSHCYAAASPAWQEAARKAPWFAVVTLPFVASGEIATEVATPQGQRFRVRAFDPSWRLLPAVYQSLDEIDVQYVARTQTISGRLATLFPGLARADSGSMTFAGALGQVREDADVTLTRASRRSRAEHSLAGDWWEQQARFVVEGEPSIPASDERSMLVSARRQVFQTWFEPYLIELAELSLARKDLEPAARAARLVLRNVPDQVTATRIALLALSGIETPMPGANPSTVLSRVPGEDDEVWLARVLSEWGADPTVVHAELTRYLAWRHGATARAVR